MCAYCDKIYKDDIELSNAKDNSFYEEFYISDGIVKREGQYDIVIPDADGDRSIKGIKYCPYCGRGLIN